MVWVTRSKNSTAAMCLCLFVSVYVCVCRWVGACGLAAFPFGKWDEEKGTVLLGNVMVNSYFAILMTEFWSGTAESQPNWRVGNGDAVSGKTLQA